MKLKISKVLRTSNSNNKVEVRSRRSAKRSSVLRNRNAGWSKGTARTDVLSYAVRAHAANN